MRKLNLKKLSKVIIKIRELPKDTNTQFKVRGYTRMRIQVSTSSADDTIALAFLSNDPRLKDSMFYLIGGKPEKGSNPFDLDLLTQIII